MRGVYKTNISGLAINQILHLETKNWRTSHSETKCLRNMNILVFQLKRLNKLVIVFFMMIIFFVLLCFENLLEDPIDPKPKKQIVINIAKDNIERSYLQLTNSKRIVSDNYSSKLCDLSQIVQHNQNISFASWPNTTENFMDIQIGGEYSPKDCQPRFSVALLIPYRNRTEHLKMFLNFIHNYLQRQEIHYRIFVIEQNDTQKFNRGKLFNIGSKFASNFGFPCLILHDVDLIPINLGHIFACSTEPRHMCSSLDIFNYTLPYLKLFGGAVAMTVDQFQVGHLTFN